MRGRWIRKLPIFLAGLALVLAVSGFVVRDLWNWLTPSLFGWHMITFWQAVGLVVLTRILFRGFPRPGWSGPGMHWRRRMMERWAQMTPEEREKFRAGMGRCGPFAASETKT
jgi:hypothetical protein